MYLILMIFLIITTISLMIYLINIFLSKKMFNIREKMTPLECGFNKMNLFRLPFSIQFYYIAILFLIFDVEISLMIPMIQKIYQNIINTWMYTFIIIIIILIIGLLFEWSKNLIMWK